jgi:hypothetical protein
MKSKEEIEQLAEKYYPSYPDGIITDEIKTLREGFIKGYRCQNDMGKKYTEEDIRNAIREGRNSIHFENDGSWWEDETVEEDFIKSLNKQD